MLCDSRTAFDVFAGRFFRCRNRCSRRAPRFPKRVNAIRRGFIDRPLAVPNSRFPLVVRSVHLLCERGDFAALPQYGPPEALHRVSRAADGRCR
jgi:hypothetical protein